MTRDEALALLEEKISNPNLVKHCLASEAILRALARKLGEDEELWGLTGLIHDLDFESVGEDLSRHTLETAEILREKSVPEEAIRAIREHNAEGLGIERESRLGIALACGETITGLVVATALVYPDKRISSVKPKSVRKRMKEKAFARAVNRETIRECGRLGLTLEEFVDLSLEAMKSIAPSLGL